MKIQTVNVIKRLNDTHEWMRSYSDDEPGNIEAESIFKKCLEEHGVPASDIDSYIEDGIFQDDNGYESCLTHSI